MEPTVISALIAFAGSLVGTLAGILTSTKITEYRLRELEKRVDKHNSLVERMYGLEDRVNIHEEKIGSVSGRIAALEGGRK